MPVARDQLKNSKDRGTVLKFRRREQCGGADRHAEDRRESEIFRQLDLSRYKRPREGRNEFKNRMIENIAAAIVLGVLVAVAAAGVIGFEQIQHCSFVQNCAR